MILTDAEAQDFVSRMGSFLYTSFLPRELAIQATVTPPLHHRYTSLLPRHSPTVTPDAD